MATHSADGIRWDLADLFSSHDDPRLEATLNDCHTRAQAFGSSISLYHGASGDPHG